MSGLAYHIQGEGPPVLLLNGIMMSMAGWEPVARELAADHLVVRCDLRGQLLSPGVPPSDLSGQVEEVIRLLDALRLDAVHVAGTSFGALVGLTLAALHAERVSSLVAMTTTERAYAEMQPLFEALRTAAAAAAAGGDKGAVFDLIVPSTFSGEWQAAQAASLRERRDAVARLPDEWFASFAGLLESARAVDLRPLLGRIRCPTLVVGADGDRTFPLERSHALAAAIAGARLRVVAGGSHGLVVERPSEVAAIVHGWIEEQVTR